MSLTKASITNVDTNERIECLFNPTEYTVTKANTWQPKNVVGRNVPKVSFTGGGQRSMTVDLFFDAYEQDGGDISRYVNKLWGLTMIDENQQNPRTQRSRPPLVLFEWGQHWQFRAVITNLQVKYTLFTQDGTPVRATATVTMQEASDAEETQRQNPTSHALPGYKLREVRPFDTLAHIAYEEYGDSTKWRAVASANNIDDPGSIQPGQVLLIPPL
jgi:hypothetical protein